MTEEKIQTYEYCKEHIKKIDGFKEKLPFGVQVYGCGTGSPRIEFELEELHREMYRSIITIIDETRAKIQLKIDKL